MGDQILKREDERAPDFEDAMIIDTIRAIRKDRKNEVKSGLGQKK